MSKHKLNCEKINLAEAGSVIEIAGDYKIEVCKGDFIIVKAGACVGSPAMDFDHLNLAKKVNVFHSFKRYYKNGGKKWFEKAGTDFFFIVPKSAIEIFLNKGYSYVDASINGVNVTFNVSGAGSGAWTDYLSSTSSIFVNHSLRDMKKIAEVSIRNQEIEDSIKTEELNDNEKVRWNQIRAEKDKSLQDSIIKLLAEGKNPVIKIKAGYFVFGLDAEEGILNEVIRKGKKVLKRNEDGKVTGWTYDYVGSVRGFLLKTGFGFIHAKPSQIDWIKTVRANAI